FDAAEEDNHSYYASQGIVDASMTFRRSLSLALMTADFVTLATDNDAVMVMLGVDEHRYVRFAQTVQARLDSAAPLRGSSDLTAVYTRMVRGFNGHPKFSKSLPGSAIDVATPPDIARQLLTNEPSVPEESATYQLMCQFPDYDADALADLYTYCLEGGRPWQLAVDAFVDRVVDLTRLWPR
ncbi:hypothetical protein ACW9HQ_50555, partial [Nocardia gipuzkoensis]